ncbi:MAG: phosphoribosyl-AMP cyclohydrolase [Rhodobacter sp.]|jgi:phosphoribosyl-AMP cyclohydrolase|nr:phosphoribosyl-AMP cyclohydrolase [Rhodobacter sp.]
MTVTFAPRISVQDVEVGHALSPRFPMDGLMPCVTTDAGDGAVLMIGWMNAEALRLTIQTGEAHYFSRTRQAVWHKGATSGLVQRVVEMRIDDDQDAVWLAVQVAGTGASCHVGYRSCFYRAVPFGAEAGEPLRYTESQRRFDPVAVYGDAPNPTVL